MKFVILLFLIMTVTAIAEWFFPWWCIALVPFLLSLAMNLRGGASFLAGSIGIGCMWWAAALWRDIPNEHVLSHKLALLFKLGDYGLFLFVTGFVGSMIGGLAAWSGALFRARKYPNHIYK